MRGQVAKPRYLDYPHPYERAGAARGQFPGAALLLPHARPVHGIAAVGETRTRDQAYIAGANDCQFHTVAPIGSQVGGPGIPVPWPGPGAPRPRQCDPGGAEAWPTAGGDASVLIYSRAHASSLVTV